MKLWIANVEPGTTDEELGEFLHKYTGMNLKSVEHVEGDGSRPAVLVEFEGAELHHLQSAHERLNGMFWKSRSLFVAVR